MCQCDKLDHIPGASKLGRKCRAELRYLQSVSSLPWFILKLKLCYKTFSKGYNINLFYIRDCNERGNQGLFIIKQMMIVIFTITNQGMLFY